MKGDQGELFALIAELDLTMPQMRGLFVLDKADHALALTELAPRWACRSPPPAAPSTASCATGSSRAPRIRPTGASSASRSPTTGARRSSAIGEARLVGLRRFAETLGEAERDALAQGLAAVFAQWDSEQERRRHERERKRTTAAPPRAKGRSTAR